MQGFVCLRNLEAGKRTAILTPRAEIFDQTHDALQDICGPSNVARLRSGQAWEPYRPIHVVSWPTLVSKIKKSDSWLPNVETVLVDEVHLALAPRITEILETYAPKARIVGFTATPARQTGKGLGTFFTHIHQVTTVRELIDKGRLAPSEYWGGKLPDLDGIRIRAGDYANKELSTACAVLVGDVVDNWLRLARDRHTIVFAVDIAHAELLTDKFIQCGVVAACVHNKLDDTKRRDIVDRFKAREIQVLVNVTIASYGFDAPSVDCVVAARPTKSIVLWLQMLGRGKRFDKQNPGKVCMVLDHADNTRSMGEAEDNYEWELNDGQKAVTNKTRESSAAKEHTHECEQCHHLFSGQRVCPRCGHEIPFSKKDVATIEADLVRIGRQMVPPLGDGWPPHQTFFAMLKWISAQRGYKPGWTEAQYRKKAGHAAPGHWQDMAAIPPLPRVTNWVTSRNIARAYAKKKAAAGEW